MNKKKKALSIVVIVVIVIIVSMTVWYFSPKIFLNGVDAADVKSIAVFDGNTGKKFHIDQAEEIKYIVENIQGNEMKRGKISINYSGYSFRMTFYDKNENTIDSFIVNSEENLRSDPFFYYCEGGLCYDYLEELKDKYGE